MRLEDLAGYVATRSNLTKFEVKSEDDTMGHLIVTETQGKINKSGEVVKPETWTVVIKLGH